MSNSQLTVAGENFTKFVGSLSQFMAKENIITNELQRFAYGTDASFYRLTPQLILRVANEEQLQHVIKLAAKYQQALTFRAAGTSLSGQAVTDKILVILSSYWDELSITDEGKLIHLKPAVIGAKANKALAPYQRKIGPDPASINSCKIGGIAANNASGMCCGVKDNSYHTLAAIKLLFADGSLLDTADKASRQAFIASHTKQIAQLQKLVDYVKSSPELVEKIRHKYRLKNTTGYGLNALIDFDDIIDVISHLMIGSEGTLAFIAEITYQTIAIKPFKMTGLYVFDDLSVACQLLPALAKLKVDAVEIMDMRALHSVRQDLNKLITLAHSKANIGALLIEFSANDQKQLSKQKQQIEKIIKQQQTHIIASKVFTDKVNIIEQLWKIRKGMFPAVGANRKIGTTVIIEDVAFPLNMLAEGVKNLQHLLQQHGYDEAIIFGHALAGNLHFVFTQSFNSEAEIKRYDKFMQALSQLVAVKYQGSLKAEHGTGRNMAPFVELEWGETLYQVMKKIKQIFDPQNIFNPDVIINADKKCHIKQLKALPKSNEIIDKCIECGFCEAVCPSKNFTLTPRQRIALWRKISTLADLKKRQGLSVQQSTKLQSLQRDYNYYGIDSCAATGLCAQACPVGIDTGEFIKSLRTNSLINKQLRYKIAKTIAQHFSTVSGIARVGLSLVYQSQKILGEKVTYHSFTLLNKITKQQIPKWYPAWPSGAKKSKCYQQNFTDSVIYIPSCANRIFGADNKATDKRPLPEVVQSVFNKAGIRVIIPENINNQCCGMPWFSKGFNDIAIQKQNELKALINQYSEQGKWAVITDASPCALTLNNDSNNTENKNKIQHYELSHYIAKFVLAKLTITPSSQTFMLHKTCSSLKMDNGQYLEQIARACSHHIVIPEEISCCGFAGDKGFYLPNLNKSALAPLKAQIPQECSRGLSNSRSCEIGLSEHSQISYQSFLYLLDEVSRSITSG